MSLTAEVVVDLAAIRENAAALGARVSPAAQMAVVKSDGYGHGMVQAAGAALAGGASWLGVISVAEAVGLRAAGFTVPVLCLLDDPEAAHAEAISHGIDLTVGSVGSLRRIIAAVATPAAGAVSVATPAGAAPAATPAGPSSVATPAAGATARGAFPAGAATLAVGGTTSAATPAGAGTTSAAAPVVAATSAAGGGPARVHLKVDTGMSRGGATPGDWPGLVDAALAAQAAGRIEITGLWSHLACADIPGHPSVAAQVAAFTDAVERAEKAGVRPEVRHLANTPATLSLPEAWFDLVRTGGGIYGLDTRPGPRPDWMRPAMTARSRLVQVKRVPSGSGVSYGHRYVTAAETTLGLVPVGYADGVPRAASGVGPVQTRGRRRTVAGTVCMNQFVIDLGDAAAEVGDEVVLFGPGDDGEPTVQDWADALGTISYEIVTAFGSRWPRSYR